MLLSFHKYHFQGELFSLNQSLKKMKFVEFLILIIKNGKVSSINFGTLKAKTVNLIIIFKNLSFRKQRFINFAV